MRNAFSTTLVEAARNDDRVRLLTGDHGYALFDEFRKVCPDQYINAGVAEQNMVGVAAGLAKAGLRPIVYGLSAFIPVRTFEQIKIDVCYEKLPVVFIGDGAGVVYSSLGASHQSTEDVAALRALPHMSIVSPADRNEMAICMRMAIEAEQPVYVRMGKADLGEVHATPPQLEWSRLCSVKRDRGELAWIATGSMVTTAITAAADWPGSSVWSAPFLKPLDAEQVAGICREHKAIIVLEEHSIYGGLASAVAEISVASAPAWLCSIGIRDRYSRYCGSYDYLMHEHKLDIEAVKSRVIGFLDRVKIRVARSPDQAAA